MYSYVLYYNIEKSGFNAVSASLVIVDIAGKKTSACRLQYIYVIKY